MLECLQSVPPEPHPNSQFHLQDQRLCFSSLRPTALPQVGCAFHVTVTPLVPSRLTVMRAVSVGASQASLDPNVTGAHGGSSTSRKAAAHVSIDFGKKS